MAKDMKASAGRTNGYDPEKVADFVRRHERIEAEIDALRAEIMRKVGAHREDQKQIADDAKDAGINKKAFKTLLKTRELERKKDKLRSDLEADEADALDLLRHALGELADTPLGEAALNGKKERTDEEAASENAAALTEMLEGSAAH